jgi:hypothetical protein
VQIAITSKNASVRAVEISGPHARRSKPEAQLGLERPDDGHLVEGLLSQNSGDDFSSTLLAAYWDCPAMPPLRPIRRVPLDGTHNRPFALRLAVDARKFSQRERGQIGRGQVRKSLAVMSSPVISRR